MYFYLLLGSLMSLNIFVSTYPFNLTLKKIKEEGKKLKHMSCNEHEYKVSLLLLSCLTSPSNIVFIDQQAGSV